MWREEIAGFQDVHVHLRKHLEGENKWEKSDSRFDRFPARAQLPSVPMATELLLK